MGSVDQGLPLAAFQRNVYRIAKTFENIRSDAAKIGIISDFCKLFQRYFLFSHKNRTFAPASSLHRLPRKNRIEGQMIKKGTQVLRIQYFFRTFASQ
jgi:hypothetical protein